MCFNGVCKYERWDGECRKKPSDPCPMAFETEEDYWEAEETKNEYQNYQEDYECSRY